MADDKRKDEATGTEFVGHEWDGIEELDTPMPRWWLWTFYATCIWGLGYTILYPAWPLIESATAGVYKWSSREQLAAEMDAAEKQKAPLKLALAQIPIERLPEDSKLLSAAVQGGRSAYKVYCVQCHGSGAAGFKGYPNLNDDDWLWGGDLRAIHRTLEHGIRQQGNDETRFSQMPAFGRDGILTPNQVEFVTSYVRTLSGAEKVGPAARRGKAIYDTNCAICHGADGKGDRTQGAPNLTDKIWLYGGDRVAVYNSIYNSRYGMMPSWADKLDPATVKMLAAYVHSLGGGEAFVPESNDGEGRSAPGEPPVAVTQNEPTG